MVPAASALRFWETAREPVAVRAVPPSTTKPSRSPSDAYTWRTTPPVPGGAQWRSFAGATQTPAAAIAHTLRTTTAACCTAVVLCGSSPGAADTTAPHANAFRCLCTCSDSVVQRVPKVAPQKVRVWRLRVAPQHQVERPVKVIAFDAFPISFC